MGKASFALWLTIDLARSPLAAGDVPGVIARLWAWQLWRRVAHRPVLVVLPHGVILKCPPWSDIAAAWVAVGFHEYSEMLFIMDLVRAGDYFIDVGANLGVYAVTAATLGAEVLAFEPGVDARRVLSENVELNGVATKVAIQPVALADFDGTARFTSTLAGSNHLMVGSGDDEAADEVEVRSLDGLLESQAGSDRSVTVLKVDAEGFDVEVLEGASKSINRDRPVIMVEQGAAAPALRKALTALGYDALEYLPQSRTMAPVPPTDVSHRNLICVHPTRRDWVEARIRTATRRDLRKPRVRWRTPTTFAQGS